MKNSELLGHLRLQMAIQSPNLKSCWSEGFVDFKDECDETKNPYEIDTLEHQYWTDGWWASFYGEDNLFEESPAAHGSAANDAVISHRVNAGTTQQSGLWFKTFMVRLLELFGAIAIAFLGYQLADIAI